VTTPPRAPAQLTRPALHPFRHQLVEWIRWFGPGRLVIVVVSAAIVVVAGLWVVSSPPPSNAAVESTVGSAVPLVTLVGAPVAAAAPVVIVHVSGAVASPGVHELAAGSRVVAALGAAGGPLPEAHLDVINLAAPLVDGQRVHVPVEGEPVEWLGGTDGTLAAPPPPVNVNRAGIPELETLPGVGPAIAAAIVDDRERHGPFGSVEDLMRVRGIGPAKIEAIAPLVTT
jgi:competence protein ComEA